ncbi:MAG: glycine cleavage system aminomethyltransferase GcvT [Clostridia bacterium]
MDRKTPLYERHVAAGGKIVPFAGYLLPVQYPAGVIAEHMAVRTAAGLFDVSHMGEARLTGPDALKNLNWWFTNDFSGMADGQVRYSPMCDEMGGILDDLIVYRFSEDDYMIVVNASNREKDMAWMQAHLLGDVAFRDVSDELCELALQGPAARAIMEKLTDPESLPNKYYHFSPAVNVGGVDAIVSRTGYTGELGYELYAPAQDALKLWDMLLEAGSDQGLIPCGLGARDTLRLEAAMPLYGHEMDESVTPIETGLGWAVKADAHDFIGREEMLQKPLVRTRVGLKVVGKGIVREHQDLYMDGQAVGHTTSGTHLPYLGGAYAMALIALEASAPGTQLEADVRGRRVACEVVPLPFYKRAKK